MAAAELDIIIEQGATFDLSLTVSDSEGYPINYTGLKARSQFRLTQDSTTTLLDLSSDNGDLLVQPSSLIGVVQFNISAVETAALVDSGGVYDLEVFDPNDVASVTRLVQGVWMLNKEVTRV